MNYKAYLHEPMYFMPTKQCGITTLWKSSPDPAPPPDYAAAAENTAQGNLEMAKYTTTANRADQSTPWGQVTWSNTPTSTVDQAGYDAALAAYNQQKAAYDAKYAAPPPEGYEGSPYPSGSTIGLPRWGDPEPAPVAPNIADFTTTTDKWSQNTTLTPELQAALDSQIAVQLGRSGAAETLLGRVQDSLSQPIDFSSTGELTDIAAFNPANIGAFNPYNANFMDISQYDPSQAKMFGEAAFNANSAMLNPEYQRQEERLRNQLALQGMSNTSEGFNNDIGQFYNAKNLAYNQLANQSLLTGNQIAQSAYQTQLGGQQAWNQNQLAQSANNQANYQSMLAQAQNARQDYASQISGTQAQNAVHQSKIQELMNKYNTPLNQLNALLTGQQVSMPQFSSYAAQPNVAGPDMLGAANLQSQYDQGVYNAGAASAASGNAAAGQAAGTIASVAMVAL
jgi:hypothetical protein